MEVVEDSDIYEGMFRNARSHVERLQSKFHNHRVYDVSKKVLHQIESHMLWIEQARIKDIRAREQPKQLKEILTYRLDVDGTTAG